MSGVIPSPGADPAPSAPTGDHNTIGRMFIGTSLLFALGAAVIGVLLRLESTGDDVSVFGGANSWFQMWTLYRMSLLLLVLAPLMLGLSMAAVPAGIGSDALAFPRAALGSFWLWLIGAAIIVVSVFAGGGWGAIDVVTPGESDAIALTLLGTVTVIFALLLGAITISTTLISLRKPGMSLLDVPPFAWSMLVASAAWLLTLPIAVANIVLIYTDLRGRPPISFGMPEGGGIWLQLEWATKPPAVYALAVPVLGIAAGMATGIAREPGQPPPTPPRKRLAGRVGRP